MAQTAFWEDKEKAQEVVDSLKILKSTTEPYYRLEKSLKDAQDVLGILSDNDTDELTELTVQTDKLSKDIEHFQTRTLLNEKNDPSNAFMSIHAGSGGTDSCDWANMLLRMYTRWLDRSGFSYQLVDILQDDEAGIKRATLFIQGPFAFGLLKAEIGVHRLVRISPFDANKRRHTSFASVDVTPELAEIKIDIKETDLQIDTYRSSGAGGQHVNKTESAVRITHIPTGAVVACQIERSQHANRRVAMKMLASKLFTMKEKEHKDDLKKMYGEKGEISWGYQIRSYVLQPYTLVKDHRTEKEVGNVNAVLDGEMIEDFIETYLKWRAGNAKKN